MSRSRVYIYTQGPLEGVQQVHCSGVRPLRRGPRLKEYLNVCYYQTRKNVAKLIPVIKLVWPKRFGELM